MYPTIENQKDYARYQADVGEFLDGMDGEPSWGSWTCPECYDEGYSNTEGCPDRDCSLYGVPFEPEGEFSSLPCDCCRRDLGGDRYDVIGWVKGASDRGYRKADRWSGSICTDCVYYLEYGRLDDSTMLQVEGAA